MQFSTVLSLLTTMAAGALASPAMITAVPRAPATSCASYTTSTSVAHVHVCPDICVEPGSPLCPIYACPMIPAVCLEGESLITPPAPAPTNVVATTTAGCTVVVQESVGCALCGCSGCPYCG